MLLKTSRNKTKDITLMSAWRQKAIQIAPELKHEFQAADLSTYTMFSELLALLRQAHKDNNVDRIEHIYNFAEWCFQQKDEKLWNAAGVSFYEHLGDNELVFSQFTKWLKKNIYLDIRGLLELRLSDEQMKQLDNFYGWNKPKI
jgi:hypothetical protein